MIKYKMSFPLYDSLKTTCNKNKVLIDIGTLCTSIGNFPIEHSNIIFLLIFHHFDINVKNKKTKLPYRGKSFLGGKGAMFVINNLPKELMLILNRYIEVIS